MYVNGQITPTKDLYPEFFLPLDDLGYTADDIYFYDSGVYENTVYTLCEGVNMTGMVCDMSTLKVPASRRLLRLWKSLKPPVKR